ncbi:sigma-70 family RNA polymerase sigma factor [Ornithinimicrobium sp. LYQ121]|uniref:sigma-70 family RNA polymerase sigma factor n=1 Tax=Ornithinimicrobium sp. LYQ121 TaxID=3378801 RepID=UPI003852049A
MDVKEFGDSVVREVPGLLRYARSLTTDPARAEDLVQETMVRALERAAGFRGESSLSTWLHRILHNVAVDSMRRDREVPAQDVVADEVERRWQHDSYTVDATEVAARAETRADLLEALTHLPFAYRTAVVLHDAEGMTMREVAQVQGVSLPAAKQRLRRGRMMLVTELARGHERRKALKGVPLRCWEARKQISEYIDGDLDGPSARRVETHLERCPTCPPLYAAIVATTEALHDLAERDPDSVIPPPLVHRLQDPVEPRTDVPPPGP